MIIRYLDPQGYRAFYGTLKGTLFYLLRSLYYLKSPTVDDWNVVFSYTTVDDINFGVPIQGFVRVPLRGPFKGSTGFQGLGFRLMTLDYGNYGIFPTMGNAGFISSTVLIITLRLRKGSWTFWGRVWALGAKVWDLSTRVQEPQGIVYYRMLQHTSVNYSITSYVIVYCRTLLYTVACYSILQHIIAWSSVLFGFLYKTSPSERCFWILGFCSIGPV